MPTQTRQDSGFHLRLCIVGENQMERAKYRAWIQDGIPDVGSIQEIDSGEEGLLACTFTPPQAMLIDDQLTDMTGFEFLEKVRSTTFKADPPLIFFIAGTEEGNASRAIQLGADEFFTKSSLSQELLCRKITSRCEHTWLLKRLQVLEHQFNTIFQSSVDALLVLSPEGRIQYANTAAEQLFHQSSLQLVGSFFEHPMTQYETKEVHIRGQGEKAVPVEMRATPIEWENRPASLLSMRNISERRKADEERQRHETERQYTQKQESLGVLAGGIAHDFNNLLMSIVARAGLALRSLPPDAPAHEHLQIIEKSGLRGGELANQMLTFAGQTQLSFQAIQLQHLLKDTKTFLRSIVSKRITLTVDSSDALPPIRGDRAQLRQLLATIVTNAAEAIGDQEGTIHIQTREIDTATEDLRQYHIMGDLPGGPCVACSIQDSGSGMKSELIPKIFDPFFSTKFPGRGLGLAALLGIVRGHGAAIAVHSQIGQGSEFLFLFPTTQTPSRPIRPSLTLPKKSSTDTTPSKVLIVDDEEEVRTACSLILKEIGFEALVAQDGKAGDQIFERYQEEITLVFLDLTMPQLDGGKLAEKIRSRAPQVPILVSSGYPEEEAMKHFTRSGINAFIQKPFQVETLIAKIQELTNLELHNKN